MTVDFWVINAANEGFGLLFAPCMCMCVRVLCNVYPLEKNFSNIFNATNMTKKCLFLFRLYAYMPMAQYLNNTQAHVRAKDAIAFGNILPLLSLLKFNNLYVDLLCCFSSFPFSVSFSFNISFVACVRINF